MTGRASTASDPSASVATAIADPAGKESTASSGVYCPAVDGVPWTLFREKCYYRYSAPFGIEGSPFGDVRKHYKTWFEAREECAKLGAKLASVHDQTTHSKLLDLHVTSRASLMNIATRNDWVPLRPELIPGDERVASFQEATWIGLQVGTPLNVTVLDRETGEVVGFDYETGCYWPASVRPRLAKDDPDPNAVDKCSVTYNDTFHGQWEDGKLYDEAESADFWGLNGPRDIEAESCNGRTVAADKQSRAFCERGVDGQADLRQHCAQIVPADERRIKDVTVNLYAGKWHEFWCWMKVRAYICERPAKQSDDSEDTSSPGQVETQTYATTTYCGVEMDTTTRLDDCANRADEIEREFNAARTGNTAIIDTMTLGGPNASSVWIGGSASFADLAQSAIDFGRSLGKISAEECIRDSRSLQLKVQDLSKTMDQSYEKFKAALDASTGLSGTDVTTVALYRSGYLSDIRNPLESTYENAIGTLGQENEVARGNLEIYCEEKPTAEDTIMKMQAYFVSPAPEEGTSEDLGSSILLDLVEYESDSKTKVQSLMAEVGAVARIGLTSLGVCAQLGNVSERRLNESSQKAIRVLSKVKDAFKRALQNNTPAASIMKQAAMRSTDRFKGELGAKRWSDRDELHQKIVNGTVKALRNHTRRRYVFNALASLPDNRTDQQCQIFPKNNFVNVGYRDLNYFILHATGRRLQDRAKSSESLCERLSAALDAASKSPTAHWPNGADIRRFSGVAAVKCGYEFVWYELGYTYFYAAYSSTTYKWEKKGGAYDARCGQIFFFP